MESLEQPDPQDSNPLRQESSRGQSSGNGDGDGQDDDATQGQPVDDAQEPAEEPDRLAAPVDAEEPPRLPFLVVGMGGSAGGLEAFMDFFRVMRPDSGMAFVLVLHLPPDRDSLLVDILSKRTAMQVQQIEDGMPVEPNKVYVIRPAHTLTIDDGRLHLRQLLAERMHSRPVDDFFKSLAAEQRERAIGVIMSGMGSNGAMGAQAIKAVGGICIVQAPESAQFPSMPRHAIDQGTADFILAPADMPEVLLRYAGHPYARGRGQGGSAADLLTAAERDEQQFSEVLAILRTRTKQDFSGYKRPTILRRIQRRMGLNQATKLFDYTRQLRQSPHEVTALADDLLIHVTGFFRDPEAWDSLRQRAVEPLVAAREHESSIRCWVTACSTGEEAYSLAILLTEAAEAAGKQLDIKVFATDMAERSLGMARAGLYPGGIESEILPERLERFFEKEDEVYRVKQELREMVVFAPQNVLQDPPFSRLDIATCRNLLIYLEPDVQRRVLALLHFGLREGGTLFLGTSETVSSVEELFEPLDKRWRIYRRVGGGAHGRLDPMVSRTLFGHGSEGTHGPKSPVPRPTIPQITHRVLLDRYAPASVTIDRDHRIVFYHGDTDRFLAQPRGEPTRDLLMLARENVRGAVRTALHLAAQQADNSPVTARDGTIDTENGRKRVLVTVVPLDPKSAAGYLLVSFQEREERPVTPLPEGDSAADRDAATISDAARIYDELQRTREELQSTIEELQTSNEELKASNEEVTSINEELQSTNEELETSKEELQSLNEELTTVNAQLQAKMEEHESASNDLKSLLSSTDIAVLFLDTRFRVRRFTPAIKDLVELISTDAGRPLKDMALKFEDPTLLSDAEAVLTRLVPIEAEITAAANNRAFLRRITPYRTSDNRIDGVVITFIDITARKKAEEALRTSEEQFRRAVEEAPIPVIMYAEDGAVLQVSRTWVDLTGYSIKDVPTFDAWLTRSFGPGAKELQGHMHELFQGARRTVDVEIGIRTRNGAERQWSFSASSPGALRDGRRFIVGMALDITERKAAQDELRAGEERFRTLVDNIQDYAIFMLDADAKVTTWSAGAQRVTGFPPEEVLGQHISMFFIPEDVAAGEVDREIKEAIQTGRAEREGFRLGKGGRRYWGNEIMTAIRNATGQLTGFAKITRDLTQRRRAEAALRENDERLRLVLEGARDFAIIMLDPQNRITMWSGGAERLFGMTAAEAVGQSGEIIFTDEDRAANVPEKELIKSAHDGKANDERWHVRHNGARFWASGVMHALREPGTNELRGYVKVLRDETARRESEDALREAKNAAELANRLKDEFMATVSHELRTPVSSVLLWANILQSRDPTKEQLAEGMRAIKQGAESQRELIDDLMDSSRISSGKLRIEMRRTNLIEVVKSAIDTILPTAIAKRVKVVGSFSEDVGTVMADPDRLRQVAWNLLTNAVKFTPAEGRVDVVLQRSGQTIELRVADTGSGIAPDFLPHIFEPFRQGDGSTTRIHGGLGLGLAITKQLVELHGGTVQAQSEGPGKGSTLIVRLPLARASTERLITSRRRGGRAPAFTTVEAEVDLAGLNVLLVEDDADTRKALIVLLETAGVKVRAFESADPALAALDQQRPDVIVSDIGLPGKDGYAFLRQVRQNEQAASAAPIPAVALTAFSRDQDRQQAVEAGFQAYLGKPVRPEQLLEAIREVARKK